MRYDEFLKLREMRSAVVLTGLTDTSKEISSAEIIEEITEFIEIRKNQMIISSGILFNKKGAGLEQFIAGCSKSGISGILLQVGPYIQQVSNQAIQLAKQAGIFLITIPFSGDIPQIISRIYFEQLLSEEQQSSMETFMMNLLYGDGERVISQMPENSFLDGRPHVSVFAAFDTANHTEEEKKCLVRVLLQSFQKYEHRLYLEEADGVAMVVLLEKSRKYMEEIELKKNEISEKLLLSTDQTISFGVSSVFTKKEGIRGAVREARKTHQILRACKATNAIRYYDNIGIYRIFFAVNNQTVLEELENEILGDLIQYDHEYNGELLNTLRVYLENDCCVKTTADELFVHRNTIKYRISQISEILGKDLKDVTVQFNLRMAFRIHKYINIWDKKRKSNR